MSLSGIDPLDPRLTVDQAIIIGALQAKYSRYVRQGRGREAHGVGSALLICWRLFLADCAPETVRGDL